MREARSAGTVREYMVAYTHSVVCNAACATAAAGVNASWSSSSHAAPDAAAL